MKGSLPWDSALAELEKLREVLEASPKTLPYGVELLADSEGYTLAIHLVTDLGFSLNVAFYQDGEWQKERYEAAPDIVDPIAEIRKLNEAHS